MRSYTINEINEILNGELVGSTTHQITGPEQLDKADNRHISFVVSKKYGQMWNDSKASAAVIDSKLDLEPGDNRAFVKVKNAELAMVKILELFDPGLPEFETEIHQNAYVHESVTIGKGTNIGAGCYVGKGVSLGDGVKLFPNVTILDDCSIGNGTIIWSGTVVRERCEIGHMCIIHSNTTIGADGFGYTPREDGMGLVKIPQIGNVIIGNGVEIGSNTCVDRGKFSSTIIGDGCKIDNLIQIAHNCILGRSVIIAATTGLAGGVKVGDGAMIGGGVSIKEQTTVHTGASVGAGSGIMNDVPAGKTVLGYPAFDSRETLKMWLALRKLGKEFGAK